MKLTAGLAPVRRTGSRQNTTLRSRRHPPRHLPHPLTHRRSGKFNAGMKINGLSLDWGFATLADLIPYAYRVKSFQVTGPSWMRESGVEHHRQKLH